MPLFGISYNYHQESNLDIEVVLSLGRNEDSYPKVLEKNGEISLPNFSVYKDGNYFRMRMGRHSIPT